MVGVAEAYVGMFAFNIGLKYGLGPLGDLVGKAVPGLWGYVDVVPGSPLITNYPLAVLVIGIFTFFMALVATYAEPALNAMGMTIELLSNGSFTKSLLMLSVALGVASGVTCGMMRLIYDANLTIFLCIGYGIAIPITKPSCLEYVAVSWDAAGVTTGSITVPLVLAMGLGLGQQLKLTNAFGLLAMGSVGPIMSVLVTGLYVQWRGPKGKDAEIGTAEEEQEKQQIRVSQAAEWYRRESIVRRTSTVPNTGMLDMEVAERMSVKQENYAGEVRRRRSSLEGMKAAVDTLDNSKERQARISEDPPVRLSEDSQETGV